LQLFVETLPNSVQHRIAEIDDDHPWTIPLNSAYPLASWWQPWEWPWAIRYSRFFQLVGG
jgi:hypothetical protein